MKDCKEVVTIQMSAYPGNFRANAVAPTRTIVEVQEVDAGLEIVVKYQDPWGSQTLTVDRIWYSPDELAAPVMSQFEWNQANQASQPVREWKPGKTS